MELTLNTISRRTKWAVLLLGLGSAYLIAALWWGYISVIQRMAFGDWLMIILATCVGVAVVHEGLHGLFFRIFGGHVKFGIKWTKLGLAPYATSPDSFSRWRFQVVALAPQLLTFLLLGVLLFDPPPMVAVGLIVAAAGNLGGGCFDLYTAGWLNKFPREYKVQDIKDGVRVVATT